MKKPRFWDILNMFYHLLRGRESDMIIVGGRVVIDTARYIVNERNGQKMEENLESNSKEVFHSEQ